MPESVTARTQRQMVIDALSLLSSATEQIECGLEAEVVESINDTFRAKDEQFNEAFTRTEIESLAAYYGLALYALGKRAQSSGGGVESLLKTAEWRAAMKLAKNVLDRIGR